MKYVCLCLILQFVSFYLYSQHEINEEDTIAKHEFKRHKISPLMGYTYIYSTIPDDSEILNDGKLVPTIGLNYSYHLTHRFALASLNDIELSSYTIIEENQGELVREFAFITVVAGIFEVLPRWNVTAGAGIELESHQNFYVLRIGTDYEVPIRNDWDVSFALEYDYKQQYSSVSFLIMFGKRFGKAR